MKDIHFDMGSIELIPDSFVQCWYNPSLVQCSKDKLLESCVRRSSQYKKPSRRLAVGGNSINTARTDDPFALGSDEASILCFEHNGGGN